MAHFLVLLTDSWRSKIEILFRQMRRKEGQA